MVLTSTLVCQVIRLKPPGQIVLDGIVHSTAECHGKPERRPNGNWRTGYEAAGTGYGLRSRYIRMFSADKKMDKRPDFTARGGKLRSEKKVMDLGICNCVHDRNGFRATRAAGKSLCRGVRS